MIAAHLATLILNWKDDGFVIVHRVRSDKTAHTKKGKVLRYTYIRQVLLTHVSKIVKDFYFLIRRSFGEFLFPLFIFFLSSSSS